MALWCSVLKCAAVCYSVLQCVAFLSRSFRNKHHKLCAWELERERVGTSKIAQLWFRAWEFEREGSSVLKCAAVCWSVVVCCSVLQYVAVCCSESCVGVRERGHLETAILRVDLNLWKMK